jgi:murein DD-endopeptidase MepM/ murein hydrolase activator NlpD
LKKKKKFQIPRSRLRERVGKRGSARDMRGQGEEEKLWQSFPAQLLRHTNEHFFQKSVAAMLVVILLGLFSLLNFQLTDRVTNAVHYLTVHQTSPTELVEQIQPVFQSARDFSWRRQEKPPAGGPDDAEEVMGAPVSGILVSPYGTRPGAAEDTEMHYGIDVSADAGSPVYAVLSGTVSMVQEHPLYGTTVYIKHGETLVTVYGRCASPSVKAGDHVRLGQQIAVVAQAVTGTSHLHFEVWKEGQPVDPQEFMGGFR